MALRHGDDFVQEQCAVYQKRRDVLVKGLRKIGWDVESPRASMFVWARVAERHLAGQGTLDLCFRLLEEADVAIAPGKGFGDNGEGYVRIALVENELRIKQALRQIDAALNGTRKHQRPSNRTQIGSLNAALGTLGTSEGLPGTVQDANNSSIIGG
jgi:alanine-synthesizing transaminase